MQKDRQALKNLGQQLSTLGAEFRLAQIGLEKMVDKHGMASPEAVEASRLCSTLALQFVEAEEKYCALLDQV